MSWLCTAMHRDRTTSAGPARASVSTPSRTCGRRVSNSGERSISEVQTRRMGIVDLSHPISDGIVTYPGLPGPAITDHLSRDASRERYAPGYEFQIGHIAMVSNTGTYLDTPFHRFPDGHDLSGLDLSRVVAVPGVLVDATAVQGAGAALLDGVDVAGRAVLFHTGWDRHWASAALRRPGAPVRRHGRRRRCSSPAGRPSWASTR